MLTRKQKWRRVKTPKSGFHTDVSHPFSLLEDNCPLPKSNSWQGSSGSDMIHDVIETNFEANGVQKTAILRSLSCSSFKIKQELFTRTAGLSSDVVIPKTAQDIQEETKKDRKKKLFVHFDMCVNVILIPRREEIHEFDRHRLWWDQDDYSKFRQVVVNWKIQNADKISPTDNILSINMGELDIDNEFIPAILPPVINSPKPSQNVKYDDYQEVSHNAVSTQKASCRNLPLLKPSDLLAALPNALVRTGQHNSSCMPVLARTFSKPHTSSNCTVRCSSLMQAKPRIVEKPSIVEIFCTNTLTLPSCDSVTGFCHIGPAYTTFPY